MTALVVFCVMAAVCIALMVWTIYVLDKGRR